MCYIFVIQPVLRRPVESTIHTLVCDNPSGMKTLFWMNGSFEFYDDNDNITDILDVFWFINHYVSYCEQNGLPVNERMFL